MFVLLVHHADALGPQVDPQRPLSSRGLTEAEALAAEASARGIRPEVIWHSGKLRARQTAECFLRACNPLAEFRMVRGLRSDDPPEWMRQEIDAETRNVLLAGHMPHISRLLELLRPGSGGVPLNGVVMLERDDRAPWREVWRATAPPAEER